MFLLLFFFSEYLSSQYSPFDTGNILFGMSSSLNGTNHHLGSELRSGISAAFEQFNGLGGIVGGKFVNFTFKDDFYEKWMCFNNTETFVNSSEYFALIGYMGDHTTLEVLDTVTYEEIPLVGALSGGSFLRTNGTTEFVNIRASYDDELAAVIHYSIRKNQKFKISILYPNNTHGSLCYTSFRRSMDAYDLNAASEYLYPEGTMFSSSENVTEYASDAIFGSSPEVVIMIGGPEELANFVKNIQNGTFYSSFSSTLFFAISFVGTVSFAEHLYNLDVNFGDRNIIVTEVVPHFDDITNIPQLSANYQKALSMIGISKKSFISFEGYIVGRFVIDVLSSMTGTLTRSGFLRTIYETKQNFYIDNFKISFSKSCNQGIRKIYPVIITSNSTFESLTDAEFEWESTCVSKPSLSVKSLIFKMSAPFTGGAAVYGNSYIIGIQTAFLEYNKQLAYTQRLIHVETRDDGYNPAFTTANTNTFLDENNTFALIGYMGTPTTSAILSILEQHVYMPYIGAYCGADFMFDTHRENFINVRAGYPEEVMGLVQVFLNDGYTKFSICFQNDSFGYTIHDALEEFLSFASLSIESKGLYTRNNVSIDACFADILTGHEPEVIIMGALHAQVSNFLKKLYNQSTEANGYDKIIIAGLSVVAPTSVIAGVSSDYNLLKNVYFSSVLPYFNDTSLKMVKDFHAVVESKNRGFISFEGYVVGRVVTEILKQISVSEMNEITASKFMDKIYEIAEVNFYDELKLGPYLRNGTNTTSCNSGLRKLFLQQINSEMAIDQVGSFEFSSCRADFTSLYTPVYFGYSCDYGDKKNGDLSAGFLLALAETKSEVYEAAKGKNLLLLSKDDNFLKGFRDSNLNVLISKGVISFVGLEKISSSLEDSEIPIIGMPRPDVLTRNDKKYIHLRSFLFDEVSICMKYFKELKKIRDREIVLVISEEESSDEISEYHKELNFVKVDEERFGDKYYIDIGKEILEFSPEFVIFAVRTKAVSAVLAHLREDFKSIPLLFLGLNDAIDLSERFSTYEYYFTSSWSRTQRIYYDFVSTKSSSQKYKDYAFYGYLIGRLISANYISSKLSGKSFGDNFFEQKYFNLDSDLVLGPFKEDCNVGIGQIYIYTSLSELKHEEEVDNCTGYSTTKFPLFLVQLLSFAILMFISLICVCCCSILILYCVYIRSRTKVRPAYYGQCVVAFTDIQSSSKLWRRDRKTMNLALKVHNQVIRREIRRYNGTEVKFIGDSFMILWGTVSDAVNCCLAIQERLVKAKWPQKLLEYRDARAVAGSSGKLIFRGLRVRVALNYCDRINPVHDSVKNTYDYVSPGINKCARIEEIARGGQICCPQDFVEMLVSDDDYNPNRCMVRRVGSYKLKGTGESEVWEIISSNLTERHNQYDVAILKGQKSKAQHIWSGDHDSSSFGSTSELETEGEEFEEEISISEEKRDMDIYLARAGIQKIDFYQNQYVTSPTHSVEIERSDYSPEGSGSSTSSEDDIVTQEKENKN